MRLKLALASGAVALAFSVMPASATTYSGFGGGSFGWGSGFGGGWGGGFGWNWGGNWNWGGGGDCGIISRFAGRCGDNGGGGYHGGGGGWTPGGDDTSPVPLPAAFPLLAGGLAVFGAVAARRKKSAA